MVTTMVDSTAPDGGTGTNTARRRGKFAGNQLKELQSVDRISVRSQEIVGEKKKNQLKMSCGGS